jgi:hypothetical protein
VQGFQKYKFDSEKLKNNGDMMPELHIENPIRAVGWGLLLRHALYPVGNHPRKITWRSHQFIAPVSRRTDCRSLTSSSRSCAVSRRWVLVLLEPCQNPFLQDDALFFHSLLCSGVTTASKHSWTTLDWILISTRAVNFAWLSFWCGSSYSYSSSSLWLLHK